MSSVYETTFPWSPVFKNLLVHNGVVCKYLVKNDGDGIQYETKTLNKVRVMFGDAQARSQTISIGDGVRGEAKLVIDCNESYFTDGTAIKPPEIKSKVTFNGVEWEVKEVKTRVTTSMHHWTVGLG